MNKKFIILKLIRAIILFLCIYLVCKYLTSYKLPYTEIILIASSAVIIQILLDIYRPIIVINENISENMVDEDKLIKPIKTKLMCTCHG